MRSRFALVRAAALSLDEAVARSRADDRRNDPLIAQAITLSTGSELLELSGSQPRAAAATRRYTMRMGCRATPFGLCAGTGVVAIGQPQDLLLAGRDTYQARVRLDIAALENLIDTALERTALENLPVYLNPTLRADGTTYRFSRRGDASADVVVVKISQVLGTIVAACSGQVSGGDLIEALHRSSPSTPREKIVDYLRRLLDRELLLADRRLLRPGIEPGTAAIDILRRAGRDDWADALAELVSSAEGLLPVSTAMMTELTEAWTDAATTLTPLAGVAETDRFHVDLEYKLAGTVDLTLIKDVEAALRRIQLIFPRRDPLKNFREAFRARYEDAAVPLLEVVDYESGVLKEALRDRSPLADRAGTGGTAAAYDDEGVRDIQIQALGHWQRTGTPFDISDFPLAKRGIARCAMAALLGEEAAPYRSMIAGATSRAPGALLGRFTLSRAELDVPLQEWARARYDDRDGGPIVAELIHTPGGRIGNVLVRTQLAPHTLAIPDAGAGDIALDRVLVRLEADTFALYDAETGRRILLELNSAHSADAFENSPIYRVLAHMNDVGAIGWYWGDLTSLRHLPRITCGSVIVAPEQWCVDRDEVLEAVTSTEPDRRLRALLPGIGNRRWVGTGHDDEVLAIDLDSVESINDILKTSSGRRLVDFIEIPQVEQPALSGPNGRHVAEVCFIPQHDDIGATALGGQPLDRIMPDRRWVYFKFYCGPATADTVAIRAKELADSLREQRVIDQWFFIRYGEDGHHVRVRAHAVDEERRATVVAELDRLGDRLIGDGGVTRVCMDTYVREIRRYGGAAAMECAERIFCADSDDIATFLMERPPEETRLLQAAATMARWTWLAVGDHDLTLEFLRRGKDGLGMPAHRSPKKRGAYWRDHERELADAVARYRPSAAVRGHLGDLVGGLRSSGASYELPGTLASILHMHCNRLFAVDSRRLEHLAYDLAVRTAVKARARGLDLG